MTASGSAIERGQPPALRARVLNGVKWNVIAQVARQASRTVVAVLLARLLTPSDYGLAAMALVLSSLVLSFSDLGLGAGIVQRPNVTQRDRSTVFWLSFAIGAALTAIGVACSGLVAGFYGDERVQPLFAAVSLSFVLMALQTTQAAILQREMNFRAIEVRLIAATVVGGVVGVAGALLGWGAWALVVMQLVSTGVSTVLLWTMSSWRPSFTFSRASLRDLGGFGGSVFGTRMLDYASGNADKLLVGRFLGSAQLGAYVVAYNVMVMPFTRLIVPIQDTLFPAFSRIQDDVERLRRVWLRAERTVGAIVVPAMVGVIVVAPDFVRVLLGSRWAAVVPVLQLLAGAAVVQAFSSLGPKVLIASGRAGQLLRFWVVATAVNVGAFAFGLRWGIVGVAACYLAVSVPIQAVQARLAARVVGLGLGAVLWNMRGVAASSAVLAAGALALREGLVAAGLPAGARLVLVAAAGAGIFVAAAHVLAPDVVAEVRSVVRRKRPTTAA